MAPLAVPIRTRAAIHLISRVVSLRSRAGMARRMKDGWRMKNHGHDARPLLALPGANAFSNAVKDFAGEVEASFG